MVLLLILLGFNIVLGIGINFCERLALSLSLCNAKLNTIGFIDEYQPGVGRTGREAFCFSVSTALLVPLGR